MQHVSNRRRTLTRKELRSELLNIFEKIRDIVDQPWLEELPNNEQWEAYHSVKKLYSRFEHEFFFEDDMLEEGDLLPDGSFYEG